jgi:hypothetical protein
MLFTLLALQHNIKKSIEERIRIASYGQCRILTQSARRFAKFRKECYNGFGRKIKLHPDNKSILFLNHFDVRIELFYLDTKTV